MEPRISMVTLGVSDLDRSRRFYVEGLGLPLHPDSNETVAFVKLGGAWLGLWPRTELVKDARMTDDGSGFGGTCIAHNVSSKEQVDAVMREVEAAGGTIVRAAEDAFWGGYLAYFADPDGFLWEVTWNPTMPELAQI